VKEKILWAVFAAGLLAILVLSKDGFYRYPLPRPEELGRPGLQTTSMHSP